MAVIKNITRDVRSLFSVDAPPIDPGGEVTVRDERFVGRAWPKSTWEVIEPPEGYEDTGPADAYVYTPKPKPKASAKKGSESA